MATRTYHTSGTYAYDAPVATNNYDRIDNSQVLLVRKPTTKNGAKMASAEVAPTIRIYKEGLHWTDNKGGFYIRKEAQLKDNNGVLYSENGSVWIPLQ